MGVFHAAELADGNPFAGFCQFGMADFFILAALFAFCCGFMRGGDGAVLGDLFFHLGGIVCGLYGKGKYGEEKA